MPRTEAEREEDSRAFLELLRRAIAAVGEEYFAIPVEPGVPMHVGYRERAYCYELYHQLRSSPEFRDNAGAFVCGDVRYMLNGELTKTGHPRFRFGSAPDLLIHEPGTMASNLVVIEVKRARAVRNRRQVEKDLQTLKTFVRQGEGDGKYARGVYLIYGQEDDPIERLRRHVADWTGGINPFTRPVHLLWHRTALQPPELQGLAPFSEV